VAYFLGHAVYVISEMWQLFFVTLSVNNLGFRGTITSTSGFQCRSIKWTFVSQKNGFDRCRREWLWNTHV